MTAEVKVLIVDDHTLVRDALAERLDREPNLRVVGRASNADQALRLAAETSPDVVLMDIDMPGLSCFEAARRISQATQESAVIFLSGFLQDRYIEQALSAKARGFLTKNEPPEVVISAILEVCSGGAYFSREVQSRIEVDSRGARLAGKSSSRASLLTGREIDILRYIARGMSKKEIAALMHISVKTVDRHSANLMNKLDIHDRVELARFAIREGIEKA